MNDGIELGKVVEQLRTELLDLTQTVGGEELRFAVEGIEVELRVGVTKGGSAGTKAKFWVHEAGGEAKYGTDRTQTIKLRLKPNLKGAEKGVETLIGAED